MQYQLFIPPSFPAFFSLHSNSTSVKKPICPIFEILYNSKRTTYILVNEVE